MNAVSKIGSGFSLQPRNLDEAMRMAEMLSQSQMVPKQYQNKAQDALVAMMMGVEVGLNPIQALQNIAVINGKPSIYGDALVALVQNNPAFGGMDETFDDSTMTATCIVWRKGGTKHRQTFSQADAQQAGLWGKSGPWTQYPKRMLSWRAKGFALRSQFADALAGLITREEAEDIPAERDVTPHAAKQADPATVGHYPDDKFEATLPSWSSMILGGKATAEQIISKVETKGKLTNEQRRALLAIGHDEEVIEQ
jgi:hypothetical protein